MKPLDNPMNQQTRVIKTQSEYDAAMARLSELMDMDFLPGSLEEVELELLALVIEYYEHGKVEKIAPDPIDAILFRMQQQNLSNKDLVPLIGSMSKVSEVLSRKRPLSLSMIRAIHKGLDIPADILIGSANDEDIDISSEPQYDYSKFPLQEMREKGCFPDFKGSLHNLKDYAEELIKGLLQDIPSNNMSASLLRAPLHQSGSRKMDDYALIAWRACVVKKAKDIELRDQYKHGIIGDEWLSELAKLSSFDSGPKLAQEYLSRYGIALVVEPHFKKTYLDGAAMLMGNTPIVALTLRHDRVDNFWFALIHELVHVRKHLNPDYAFIADNLDDKTRSSQEEIEADDGARDALIPKDVWENAKVRESHLQKDAIELANILKIHPAIVAGRVRNETNNWRLLNKLINQAGSVRVYFENKS